MTMGAAQAVATERRFVQTRSGRIHVAMAGRGFPVLLLHQTPRSWDEFRDVLPLLGQHWQAIAMDTVGFGDSEALPMEENSIERWAEAAVDLLDALGIERAVVAGHHTGAVIAMEMAASRPDRVAALVLSSCPYVDAPRRASHHGKPVIDEVEHRASGEHLVELWRRRQPFYPAGDIDLLQRFIADALKAGALAAEGHHVVNRYEMEHRFARITSPTLVIAATDDPHAFPSAARVAAALPGSTLVEIAGGRVPLPDQMPAAFADAVSQFLDGVGLGP